MQITIFLIGLLMIGCGFLVKKYPNLIVGYNTMSAKEKENVDIDGLSSFMRNGLIIIGTTIIIGYYLFELTGLDIIADSIVMIIIIGGVIIIVVKAQKYTLRRASQSIAAYIGIGLVIVGIAIILLRGSTPTKIIMNNSTVQFTGMYGYELKYEAISKVELVDKIPPIQLRVNGFNFAASKKGYFRVSEMGKCKLFLYSNQAPYLIITTNSGENTIINNKDSMITKDYYNKILEVIRK